MVLREAAERDPALRAGAVLGRQHRGPGRPRAELLVRAERTRCPTEIRATRRDAWSCEVVACHDDVQRLERKSKKDEKMSSKETAGHMGE